MNARRLLTLGGLAWTLGLVGSCGRAAADDGRRPVVRLADLEIEPGQVAAYTAALREEIETSLRVEPGVLTLYAVSVAGDPARIRLFEMYADANAYRAHIASPHFTKYKTGTHAMVKSLILTEMTPLLLGTKRTEVLRAYITVP